MSAERRAAVQPGHGRGYGTIAWEEHVRAWGVYARRYGSGQSAERIHDRGGFGYGELVSMIGYPTTWCAR